MITHANAWMEKFFSEGNEWDLPKIKGVGYPKKLQLILESMLHRAFQDTPPYVLPRLHPTKQLSFYLIGADSRELSELRRVISAHLGNVKTNLDPRIFVASDDPIERVILTRFPHGFSKLSIPIALNENKPAIFSVLRSINDSLNRLLQRPSSVSVTQRPTGRILSDFFVACNHRNGDATQEFFDELKVSGQLSTRNLLSIELQVMAAGGKWHGLLIHPKLPDILSGRIPGAITDVLLETARNTSIPSVDPSDCELEVIQHSLHTLGPLFLRRPNLGINESATQWKVWGIGACSFGYSRVLDIIPSEVVGEEWIHALARWAGLKIDSRRPDDLLDNFISAEPSLDNAVNLLQQSLAMNQREGLVIYQRLSDYPHEVIEEFRAHSGLRLVWDSLITEFGPKKNINNWTSWLRSISTESKADFPSHELVDYCRYWHAAEWNEEQVVEQLFALADSPNSSIFRDVIPVLWKWLQENKIETSATFIEQVLVILTVDDVFSIQDLSLIADLLGELTTIAHSEDQYKDVVGTATVCWERVKSVNSLGQGLEVMEELLDSPCAVAQSRLGFWNSLQEFCVSNWERLTISLQLLVLRIAQDSVGTTQQFPPLRQTEDIIPMYRVDLANKRVAIYTLTESAGRRASTVLSEMFPDLEILLNHDKSATDALVNLAKTADYFVFASRSAAHQAFFPVTRRRDDIIYPTGKGSSSIVRGFLEAIQG